MSRFKAEELKVQGALKLAGLAAAGAQVWSRFLESRLFVQILLSLLLVAFSWLVLVLPGAPASAARRGLLWMVGSDYDFAGKVTQVTNWAREQGGWMPAISSLGAKEIGNARAWIEPYLPAGTQVPEPPVEIVRAGGPVLPVDGARLHEFGWLPEDVMDQFHYGIDLAAPLRTPVVAILDGTVVRTALNPELGQVVEIDHGDVVALYAQVDGVKVTAGARVRKGERIAVVGKPAGTEAAEMAHLHFELRRAGRSEQIDPAPYLGLGGSKI